MAGCTGRLPPLRVTDDPFYAPGFRLPSRQRKPREHVWSMRWRNATWHYELLFRGESYGWEAQVYREGDFTIGRRFILKEEGRMGRVDEG